MEEAAMSTSEPFEVTPEALDVIAELLQRHPDLQAGLFLVPNLEVFDEKGALEARFEKETFWMAYDSPEHFLNWPRVELCGRNIPIARDALEILRGKTLTVEVSDVMFEGHKHLVASDH